MFVYNNIVTQGRKFVNFLAINAEKNKKLLTTKRIIVRSIKNLITLHVKIVAPTLRFEKIFLHKTPILRVFKLFLGWPDIRQMTASTLRFHRF